MKRNNKNTAKRKKFEDDDENDLKEQMQENLPQNGESEVQKSVNQHRRKFQKRNRKQNIKSEKEKFQILPNWMKNGQILENWSSVNVMNINEEWINNNLKTIICNYVKTRSKKNNKTNDNNTELINLFPVQIAALPAFTRSMKLTKTFLPIFQSSSSPLPSPSLKIMTSLSRQKNDSKIIRSIFLQKRSLKSIASGDLLISAPTGSGKTLAYAIPLIQSLEDRIIPQIRAVILLPSRDLAIQVFNVLQQLIDHHHHHHHHHHHQTSPPTKLPLRVISCFGQTSFKDEQNFIHSPYIADIIVATPGRLIDHINSNLNLQYVQYLIIDEADRLLMESYQDWVYRVFNATRVLSLPSSSSSSSPSSMNRENKESNEEKTNMRELAIKQATANDDDDDDEEKYQSLLDQLENSRNQNVSNIVDRIVIEDEKHYSPLFTITPKLPNSTPLRKYLVSATLTRNPAKIASLHLNNPLYFHSVASGRFKIPNSLLEYMVVCKDSGEKPLVLISLLNQLGFGQTLCFTKSVESTHRLYLLLKLMGITEIAEYSSTLPQLVRTNIIQQFRNSQLKVLICSDAMARGMDLEHISTVINYDVPTYIKTYVHRIGRTARAGKEGTCFSILRPEDVHHFKDMRRKAEEPERLKSFKVPLDSLDEEFIQSYESSLSNLKSALDQEKQVLKSRQK